MHLKELVEKDTHFSEYIGCSLDELKLHLETQFKEGIPGKIMGLGKLTTDSIALLNLKKNYINLIISPIYNHYGKKIIDEKEINWNNFNYLSHFFYSPLLFFIFN